MNPNEIIAEVKKEFLNKVIMVVHKTCGSEVKFMAPDGIAFCPECEIICEGELKPLQEN